MPAYVYCIFSFLVSQINLQSYVTRKLYLTLLPAIHTAQISFLNLFHTIIWSYEPHAAKQNFQLRTKANSNSEFVN